MRDLDFTISYVIGQPIHHSLSPTIHNYWLDKYSVNGVYLPQEISSNQLSDLVVSFNLLKIKGANITIPHKVEILNFADVIHPMAQLVGAANTIWFDEHDHLHADNTDVFGFIENIKEYCQKDLQVLTEAPAVILGAGGASRAVLVALSELGFKQIILLNRSREKAEHLAEEFRTKLPELDFKVGTLSDFTEFAQHVKFLVNTTSLGMVGQPDLKLSLELMPSDALVTDIVYAPLKTTLLKEAERLGLDFVTGIGMLLHQARPSFERWYGFRPEIDATLKKRILSLLEMSE